MRWVGACLVLGLMLCGSVPSRADDAPLGDAHLGVASCKGSPCHGAATDDKKTLGVLQDEYQTWARFDKHAKAYTVLLGERGERIAANLGLGKAENAGICLDCHADNVPLSARGVEFHLQDGVGCEACHGGAQRWLGPHVSGRVSHADLVRDSGLYATDRPVERAKLCLNCHVGDADRFVSHKIMGAGHPRLSFELQTFTQIEPAHFRIDATYRARKAVAKGVQFWAVGQAMMVERLTSGLADPKRHGAGAFPELVFFDCQACHHSLNTLRWQKREDTGLDPGTPHLNDANAVMLRAITLRVAPDLGRTLAGDMRALHQIVSAGNGQATETALKVAASARKLADAFAAHDFTRDDLRAMLLALVEIGRGADISDYAAAEQATMAMASIIDTLHQDGNIDAGQFAGLKTALDQCYAAILKDDSYEPQRFANAAQALGRVVPSW